MRKILLLLFVGVMASGCVVGNTYRYDLGDAEFSVDTNKTVAVTTLDLRDYVLSGDKTPSFVGLMRGGIGVPFDVTTSGGRPLAEDMTTSIVAALKNSNVRAVAVAAPPDAREPQARKALLAADANRFVLLLLREWKTDTYVSSALIHDVTLTVMRRNGTELAKKTLQGNENIGTGALPADARVNAEKAFKRKLEEAINDPKVAAALR